MSDRYFDNLLPDFGEYSLDSVLETYRKRSSAAPGEPAAEPIQPAQAAEAIAQRSRQIVMEALGETLKQHRTVPELDFGLEDLDDLIAPGGVAMPKTDGVPVRESANPPQQPAPEDTDTPLWEKVAAAQAARQQASAKQQPAEQAASEPAPADEPAPEAPKKPRVHVSPDGVITLDIELPPEEPEEEPEYTLEEPEEEPDLSRDRADRCAASAGKGRKRPSGAGHRPGSPAQNERPSAKERFLTPIIRLIATRLVRRQMQKAEAANWPEPVDIRETDELPPKRAFKFYAQQLRPLRFRCRVCSFLSVTLCWISMGLPMAGLLGTSPTIQAGVSLLLLMTVMVATLDILAAGMRQLFDLRPGAEALATLGAMLSCVDAVMVLTGYGRLMPFCAVSAVSLACALWGEKLDCTARARTMRTAAVSQNPSAVTAEQTSRGGKYICRSQRPAEGVVRRSEQADLTRTVYCTAAPVLMLLSLGLATLSSLDGRGAYFLHTLSALLCVSASFTAFLSFPLPYCLTAGKLQNSGAAIAGYAGCADIGKARRVVISDNDLFPPGTMKLTAINVLEGAPVEKVVSGTASLLAASGSGVTDVFMELMRRRKYQLIKPEEFRCHEGGGLSARVDGEQVLVGSAGFMNLMGIRLPQNLTVRNAICTAISGELVGVFNVEYTPVSSVQDALVILLQGRTQPIFAIRDFNITPLMIRHLFRMPTDNFNFPTFRDRYRIAASAAGMDSPIAAVLSRGGMGPMVDAAESGRKLYSVCRTGTVLSLVGTVIGMVTIFLLFRAGAYDTATAGNVLSYMLLWALPVVILAYGQSR